MVDMSAPLDSLSARFKDGKSKRETPELQPAIVNARLKPAITPHAPRAYSDQNATRIPRWSPRNTRCDQ
ncbi:hypothetical protein [Methyloceanibacter marginalis]|uniref:hypothetical protein n=1 Tax=Methyloceanibacter marginalis TaxID=1774971 RepID=UPI001FCD30D6|nr:hypothetical protein [Methyloceanibacter marginalis]